jgi:hypothetical protein
MGCCNKVYEDRPISRLRYVAGMCLLLASHAFVRVLLTLGAPFSPRYRKLLPAWRSYSREVLRSCRAREGFRVGGAANAACECEGRPTEGPGGGR